MTSQYTLVDAQLCIYKIYALTLARLAAFNRESYFTIVVKFVNFIGICCYIQLKLRACSNQIHEFYSGCKAASSSKRSHLVALN